MCRTPADLIVSLEIILSKPRGLLYRFYILLTRVHTRDTKRAVVGSGAYELKQYVYKVKNRDYTNRRVTMIRAAVKRGGGGEIRMSGRRRRHENIVAAIDSNII